MQLQQNEEPKLEMLVQTKCAEIQNRALEIHELCRELASGLSGEELSLGTDHVMHGLESRAEMLHQMVEASPVFVVELTPDMDDPIIMRTTRALEQMFEYRPGELNGQPVSILVPEGRKEQHKLSVRTFLRDPHDRLMSSDVRPEGVTRTGRVFPVIVMWSQFFVDKRHFLSVTVMPQISQGSKQ